MKVLYLHANQPDYLAESLFHGLRELLGHACVDVPRYDSMYKPLTEGMRSKLRGHGFTLYGLLSDDAQLAAARYFWRSEVAKYDLVIVANIWQQWALVRDLLTYLSRRKLVVLDGSDGPTWFPWSSALKTTPSAYFTRLTGIKYFKRELMGNGLHLGTGVRHLPQTIRSMIPIPGNARKIAFSIPEEKVSKDSGGKRDRQFPTDLVDAEVAAYMHATGSSLGRTGYIYDREEDYYSDLRNSRFGVTMKRAGWDCLRHYELAANGSVLCFRDLDRKPVSCAPHGLDNTNSITYRDVADLLSKISKITPERYLELKSKTYEWARRNTTVQRAREFLEACP